MNNFKPSLFKQETPVYLWILWNVKFKRKPDYLQEKAWLVWKKVVQPKYFKECGLIRNY